MDIMYITVTVTVSIIQIDDVISYHIANLTVFRYRIYKTVETADLLHSIPSHPIPSHLLYIQCDSPLEAASFSGITLSSLTITGPLDSVFAGSFSTNCDPLIPGSSNFTISFFVILSIV